MKRIRGGNLGGWLTKPNRGSELPLPVEAYIGADGVRMRSAHEINGHRRAIMIVISSFPSD